MTVRTNTANGGTTYVDMDIQVVNQDNNQMTLRAVIYLTSLNVSDSSNDCSVTGQWSRGGALSIGGVYNQVPVWYQDVSFPRANYSQVGWNLSWSGVNYWGTTLSGTIYYTIPPAVTVPAAPSIGVDSVTATSAHLYAGNQGTGGGSVDSINYRIHRVSDGAHMGDIQGGWAGVTYTNLAPGILYDGYAQAHNEIGWSGFSGNYRFVTASTVPGPITVAASGATATSVFAATTSAALPNGATVDYVLYRVYRVSDGALITEASGGYAGVTLSGLVRATQYNLVGYAHNAIGYGPQSAAVRFDTLPSIPGAPTITSITGITPTSAVVSWSPPADNGGQTITAYDVEYSADNWATKVTQATGTLSNLVPGTTYKVRVRAKNASGNGPYSTESALTTFTTQTGMKVYNGTAFIDAPVYAYNGASWQACEVRIYNGSAWVPTG